MNFHQTLCNRFFLMENENIMKKYRFSDGTIVEAYCKEEAKAKYKVVAGSNRSVENAKKVVEIIGNKNLKVDYKGNIYVQLPENHVFDLSLNPGKNRMYLMYIERTDGHWTLYDSTDEGGETEVKLDWENKNIQSKIVSLYKGCVAAIKHDIKNEVKALHKMLTLF